jgi:hypothetical protein
LRAAVGIEAREAGIRPESRTGQTRDRTTVDAKGAGLSPPRRPEALRRWRALLALSKRLLYCTVGLRSEEMWLVRYFSRQLVGMWLSPKAQVVGVEVGSVLKGTTHDWRG